LLTEFRSESGRNSTSRRSCGNHQVLKICGCCYTTSAHFSNRWLAHDVNNQRTLLMRKKLLRK
jgi:hypothetical protein